MQGDASRVVLLLALRGAGIRDLDVLRAMETVPREAFLPEHLRHFGPRNVAVPLPCGQTMPSPLTLALMLEALDAQPGQRVLEVGTGSGYGTALLARIAGEVVSFERYRTLAAEAEARLAALGIDARIVFGDGLVPARDFGHFDRILVHAALSDVPSRLLEVLAEGGRIVAGVPAGEDAPASLASFDRGPDGLVRRLLTPIRLSPVRAGVAGAL